MVDFIFLLGLIIILATTLYLDLIVGAYAVGVTLIFLSILLAYNKEKNVKDEERG